MAVIAKTKRFNGKTYELLTGRLKNKKDAEFSVLSWRSRGRNRGARMVKVDGGYVIYVRG